MLAEETKIEFDPFAAASDPVVPTYDLFGQVMDVNAWACGLVSGTGGGKFPYDPAKHNKRYTAVDIFIQPLDCITVKNTKHWEEHWIVEFKPWAGITWPSIKAAGIENLRELKDKWVRVARVPNGKKYAGKDRATGQPTGETFDELTYKFVEIYATEEDCRAAYVAAGGKVDASDKGHNVPSIVVEDPAKATAHTFLKAIVPNAVRGKTTLADAQAAAQAIITQYAPVAAFFNAESPETLALIAEVCPNLTA